METLVKLIMERMILSPNLTALAELLDQLLEQSKLFMIAVTFLLLKTLELFKTAISQKH
jgi:hypothetical protein